MKMSPRRRSREFAMQALYQTLINRKASVPEILSGIRASSGFHQADAQLFEQIFLGAHAERVECMQLIRPQLDRDENMVNPVEKSILLMAVYELKAMPQTPYPVVINEAIEITKTFGGSDSHKFVNGILDKLAAKLRPNDPKRA